jgi:hypothetical protein
MNNTKKTAKMKSLFVIVSAMMMVVGCTSGFTNLNTNPNEATEEMLDWDNVRTGSYFLQMEENVLVVAQSSASIGTDRYETVETMGGDGFVGYFGFPSSSINSAGRYNWNKASWYGDMFTTNYSRTMSAWRSLKNVINNDKDPRSALALIIKVAAMHRVTDTYGPIPYVKFGVEQEVPYDSQQDVYYKFFDELDQAITVLQGYAASGTSVFSSWDCVYRGDVTKWIKFANSLRLRLAMHLSYIDPTKAKAEAQAAIDNSIGLMSDANDIATLQHISPIELYESPLYIIGQSWNDARMGATLASYMNGYSDPRLSAYFYKTTAADYKGIRAGMASSVVKSAYAPEAAGATAGLFSVPIATSTSDVVWMRASESYFLLAEAALRWGIGSKTAKEYYELGITTSFTENNVSGTAAYIANTTATPSAYVDPVTSSYSATALGTITIAWDETATDEQKLERIITQKYIALFPVGQEAWTEFRRTGYPKVFPVCVNESNGGCVNTSIQIRRLPFPVSEYNTNSVLLQGGISLLGGADNPGTKLWWDAK